MRAVVRQRKVRKVAIAVRHFTVSVFVDRASQQWIVRDANGDFWIVPSTNEAWSQRRPFTPTEQTELESVPGHYLGFLGLPF